MLLSLVLACSPKNSAPAETGLSSTTDTVTEATLSTLLSDAQAGDDILLHPDGFLVASDPIGDGGASLPTGTSLREIHLDGTVEVYAEGLVLPLGNDIDADGNVYAVEWGGQGRLFKVGADRAVSTLAAGMSYASNVVAHPNGVLYVTAWGDDAIYQVDPGTGERTTLVEGIDRPVGLALDADGVHLLVSSFSHGEVHRVSTGGEVALLASLPESGDGAAADLVATDSGVYVTSFGGNCIYRVDDAGVVEVAAGTGEAGGSDGPALEATLDQPNGIAASADGRTLYIQEFGGALRVLSLD